MDAISVVLLCAAVWGWASYTSERRYQRQRCKRCGRHCPCPTCTTDRADRYRHASRNADPSLRETSRQSPVLTATEFPICSKCGKDTTQTELMFGNAKSKDGPTTWVCNECAKQVKPGPNQNRNASTNADVTIDWTPDTSEVNS